MGESRLTRKKSKMGDNISWKKNVYVYRIAFLEIPGTVVRASEPECSSHKGVG
jgi:hypothetical protein